MCLIKDDQIPVYASDMVNLFFSKLVGTNYNVLFVIKRITICIGKNTVEIFGLQNYRNLHWAWASGKAVGEGWKK